jgi:arylsulfatase A-like enzyme
MFYKLVTGILLCCVLSAVSACRKTESGRVALDLSEHLEDADLLSDTTFIGFEDPSSRNYLGQGWGSAKAETDGIISNVLQSNKASLWFYSFYSKGKQLKIRCKIAEPTAKKILLIPSINNERLETIQISSGYEEYKFDIPEKSLRFGSNELTLQIRNRAYSEILVDHISFSSDFISSKPKTIVVRNKDGVAAPVPSQIGIYLKIPSQANLQLEYGLRSQTPGFVNFLVRMEDTQNQNQILLSKNLPSGLLSKKETSQSISLSEFNDRIVRLVFEALPVEGKPVPQQVYWRNLKLEFSRPSVPNTRDPDPPIQRKANIFFYLVDALRADHLEPYGYTKPVSPRIKKFAQEGVLFERAYSQSSWTRPAVASILTGLYPSSHGTMDRGDMLSGSIPTLQSLLRSSGYRMYGINAQPNVGNAFGFDRNFDFYRLVADSDSEQVYREIDRAFRQEFVAPAFTYIHVIDTHRPYSPRPEFFPESKDCRAEKEIDSKLSMDCAMALYDALVLQSDYYFGAFLDLLKERNLYEDSMIIFTADHGESFMEHGIFGHGKSLYETEIRVPLIIRFPGGQFAGKKIDGAVQHIDLLPTILNFSATALPKGLEGMSLLEFLKGKTEIRPVYSELSLDKQNDKALILGDYKLIRTEAHSGPRYKLHHVVSDPEERKNLAGAEPVRFGYMRTMLGQWKRSQQKKNPATEKAILDEQTKEQLRGLGYVQ